MALAAADAALDVALAGPEDVTRAVQASLPAPLRARVIGTLRVDPKRTTASTITRQTKQLQETWAQLVP
jgi:hypothetical protein